MTITYGKYRGWDVQDIPIEYLTWLLDSNKQTAAQVEEEIRRREMEDEADATMTMLIVKTGYRELSKKYHPDAGGDHDDMVELNAAYKSLLGMVDA